MLRSVRAAAWAAAVALAFPVAACGGGGSGRRTAGGSGATAIGGDAGAQTTAATVREKTVPVSKTFLYAGFKVNVKSAALRNGRSQYGGPAAPVVSLTANFENVGADRARFSAETVLESAGRNHFETGDGQDIPEVPGGANQDGTIVIIVDPTFRFDDAVLVVGKADTNQARVPLGKTGELVAYEPRAVPVTARLSTVSLNIDVRGGELRADVPHYHRQVDAGRRALELSYTASLSGCQFVKYDLTLGLPDGTTADAIDGAEAGKTDNFSVFLVSDHPAGAYTLKLRGEAKGSTGPGCPINFSAEAPFSIA